MKSKSEIAVRIAQLELDTRYQAGLRSPATVDINAPLTLIQRSLKTQIDTLRWVLGES